jgi:hypothetical protein
MRGLCTRCTGNRIIKYLGDMREPVRLKFYSVAEILQF